MQENFHVTIFQPGTGVHFLNTLTLDPQFLSIPTPVRNEWQMVANKKSGNREETTKYENRKISAWFASTVKTTNRFSSLANDDTDLHQYHRQR